MRILAQIRGELIDTLAAAAPDDEIVAIPTDGDLDPGLSGEILLTLPWGAPNLDRVLARGVRWVHAIGTGVDGFPFERLSGQVLTCSRGASAVPISEWVLAMLLAFEKRLPESWVRHPVPRATARAGTLGTLEGRTLGLVGFGGIGSAVARLALAFGMRVRAVTRTARASVGAGEVSGVEFLASARELVAASDHIVIAAPATAATRHLFDRALFAAVKPGVHLVNVSRGALVDPDALREALDDGRVARASLDTVEPEPLPEGHWMYDHPGVRLSPHVSWQRPGATGVLLEAFVENLRRYRNGEPLSGVVDLAEGY